jgi:hypothetical protein
LRQNRRRGHPRGAIDDVEVAVPSSESGGVVVASRRIDARISQQSFDDREVAEMSSRSNGELSSADGSTRTSCFEIFFAPSKQRSSENKHEQVSLCERSNGEWFALLSLCAAFAFSSLLFPLLFLARFRCIPAN